MIPENPLLGSLRECPISWFRVAKGQLTAEQIQELSDPTQGIWFGCWNGYDGPEWGMSRDKTIVDLEKEHGKVIHVKKNWNGKTEGIQFENKWFSFNMMKSSEKKIEGINDLPVQTTEDGRCKGFFNHGGRCTHYARSCGIKSHKEGQS